MIRTFRPWRLAHVIWAGAACVWLAGSAFLGPVEAMTEDEYCGLPLAGCKCAAQFKETKLQPGFNDSCLQSVTATIWISNTGCCTAADDEDEIACLPKKCKWSGVKVEVVPSESCTIRIVVGGTPGTPTTIKSKTSFTVPNQEASCYEDLDDLFKLQARNALGVWVDCFELTLHCKGCSAHDGDGG